MNYKFSLVVVSLLLIISSCNDKNSDTEKRKHALVDSIKKTMAAYTPEKMIEHYKTLNGVQKAATMYVDIDFQRLTTILANIDAKDISWVLAAYDEENANLYVKENEAWYRAKYPAAPPLELKDILNKPTVVLKIEGSTMYLNPAKICPPPPTCD